MANTARAWPSALPASEQANRTSNPIRKIVDYRSPPNPNKTLIPLDIGDPTTFGDFNTDPYVTQVLSEHALSARYNGYVHSCGSLQAREAIARYVCDPHHPLTADDVIIASGCSGALELCFTVLANAGDNILLPQPGFSLYRTLASSKGIDCKYYQLRADRNWEVDLADLESRIDDRTKAILVNNPSNPCGSVFSAEHIRDIIAVADRYALPIIADEIYAHMSFGPTPYTSFASQSTTVPILSVGGLAKRFLVPGWRLGWITIHDRNHLLQNIVVGLRNLTTLILGACNLIQSILPLILSNVPQSFFDETNEKLKTNGNVLATGLNTIPGLKCVPPQGAMYLMVQIDVSLFKDLPNDLEFFSLLLKEESVSVLPGQVFGAPNFVRLVTCPSANVMKEVIERIRSFCERHYR